ncbi:MAG: hypothetical protein PGN24_04310 [Microbacterium arborescens]
MSDRAFAVISLLGEVPGLEDAPAAPQTESPTASAAVGPFRVIAVDDAASADEIVEAVAAASVFTPWILLARADQHEQVADVVERVLDGAIGVFGLAGVVIVGGDVPSVVGRREVPAIGGVGDAAAAIRALAADIDARGPRVPEPWARVIASSRTDVALRALFARRALVDDPAYRPRALTEAQLSLLRDVSRRIVPQDGPAVIDLAARVDRIVADGDSDGWRPSGMSSDAEAYRAGLDALATGWMRGAEAQDGVIRDVIDGRGPDGGVLTPKQLSLWFEDARNDLIRMWLSHPASLARVGYTGFATGGTGPEPAGYLVLAAGEREEWEPDELGRLAPVEGRSE